MGIHAQRTLADPPAGVGAVEHGQVLFLEIGRAFQSHGAADMQVGGVDVGARKAQSLQHVEIGRGHCRRIQLQHVSAEGGTQRVFVENEADVEGRFQGRFNLADLFFAKPLATQGVIIEAAGIVLQRAVAHGIGDDGIDFRLAIAEIGERLGHAAVDDLEIAAARQGLELDQGEIRLDSGGVAIHHQPDGAGGAIRWPGRCGSHAVALDRASSHTRLAACARSVSATPEVQRHGVGGQLS